jgi:SAM-dependent methyltransferase
VVSEFSEENSVSFACRACGSRQLAPVIDLGETPLANALCDAGSLEHVEKRYPLRVMYCEDCCLVQITETVPPHVLFSDYVYFSSFSDSAVAAAMDLAHRLIRERKLSADSLVMEAASNDGYLLQHYHRAGIPVLGVEPAANIAKVANEKGIRTRCAFFDSEEADKLAAEGFGCDVFHANNVLAHVADLNGFVSGIASVLKPGGVASIEVPYVRDLIEKTEFDTIYHEHLCYFSATSVEALFARHGLALVDVERIAIHGGSLRLFVALAGAVRTKSVADILEEEQKLGMTDLGYYADFAQRVNKLKESLLRHLRQLKGEGRSLAAYGASAKGSTLLNYFGIGSDLIDFVADRSTVKQGKFTPGSHLAIVSPDEIYKRKPDFVLLLTWNFADEILAQHEVYRQSGGKFILPVPEFRIL